MKQEILRSQHLTCCSCDWWWWRDCVFVLINSVLLNLLCLWVLTGDVFLLPISTPTCWSVWNRSDLVLVPAASSECQSRSAKCNNQALDPQTTKEHCTSYRITFHSELSSLIGGRGCDWAFAGPMNVCQWWRDQHVWTRNIADGSCLGTIAAMVMSTSHG